MTTSQELPDDLPVPEDDGAAAHLPGTRMPDLLLPATDGREIGLSALGPGRTILYIYPLTGEPGVALPNGWDEIPGARGCTPEACAFRDHHLELRRAGAERVFGLSSQDTDYQAEVVHRLHLPFALLADPGMRLSEMLRLPTFTAERQRLYARLTMIVTDDQIEHIFYPVFPPDEHAQQVLAWLRAIPEPAELTSPGC